MKWKTFFDEHEYVQKIEITRDDLLVHMEGYDSPYSLQRFGPNSQLRQSLADLWAEWKGN